MDYPILNGAPAQTPAQLQTDFERAGLAGLVLPPGSVVSKFVCNAITDYGQHAPKEVKLAAQYDMSIPEDRRFQKATPWGECIQRIDNPAAVERLKIGQAYYVALIPVPPVGSPNQQA